MRTSEDRLNRIKHAILRAMNIRPVPADYGAMKCEWQECEEDAACLRDTPWGDLPVCNVHAQVPLDGGREEG